MITLYGASGHAKVVVDIIHSNDASITDIIDDNAAITHLKNYAVSLPSKKLYSNVIIAIGNNKVRKHIANSKANLQFSEAIIHNDATVSNNSSLGIGTVVMAKSVVNSHASIGEHCIINTASVIEHDVVINDFVHIAPGAIVTGGVTIGENSQIGAGAIVLPNLTIAKNVVVGAGAVVTKNLKEGAVVVGNPAKELKIK